MERTHGWDVKQGLGFSRRMIVVLFLAMAWFLLRGPVRAMHGGGGDLAAPYVAGERFLHGQNPYSSADFMSAWLASGARAGSSQNLSGIRPVYPPSTLLLMLPFSVMRWPHALVAFEMLCSLLYLLLSLWLARYAGGGWRATAFIVFGLALAPVQTGLAVGNVTVLAFLLATYSFLLWRQGSEIPAGVLLSLSLCLKPTVAAPLLLYYLFRRDVRSAVWALSGVAVLGGGSLLRMRSVPRVWTGDYQANVRFLFGPGGVANFTSSNNLRFDILNLQVPFFVLTGRTLWANVLAWTVAAGLLVGWLAWFRWSRVREDDWQAATALLLMGLMPVYQRNYNAGFVLLAALCGFQQLKSAWGKGMLALCAIALVPGEAILRVMASRTTLWQQDNFVMNFLLMPQLTWAILAIIVMLLAWMRREALSGE